MSMDNGPHEKNSNNKDSHKTYITKSIEKQRKKQQVNKKDWLSGRKNDSGRERDLNPRELSGKIKGKKIKSKI